MTSRPYRLLLVEDDVVTQPELIRIFEIAGFVVETAVTGLQASRLLREQRYDAVVLDNMIPPGGESGSGWSFEETEGGLHTGLKILREMKSLPKPPPVWVVTALPDTDVESEERNLPFVVGYFTKPTSLWEVANQILSHLGGSHGEV